MSGLTRTLKLGCVGADVEGWARGAHRYLNDGQLFAYTAQRQIVKRTYGLGKQTLAKQCAKKAGLPQYGVVGPKLFEAMRKAHAFDITCWQLFDEYEHANQPLIQPVQGFRSLHESLWRIYSIGRNMGLHDLGTYNPDSRLPGGGLSDHAVYPAMAFDLGVDPDLGFAHPAGRAFFDLCMSRPEVEYVILGDRIGIRATGIVKPYSAGGHMNHAHVSGNR